MSLYLGNNLISGTQTLVGESRNIGQIIPSTIPLVDAGLHLLDGALIDGYGIYSAFVEYIASIYDASASYFCTEAEWQQSVTDYGVCGKFVYDSVANTVRLPKITGILEGTTDVTALGDLVEQFVRLPNITGYVAGNNLTTTENGSSSGALYYGGGSYTGPSDAGRFYGPSVNIDASRSSSVYSGDGTNTVIQPQTIKCYYYIVIATSTKTDIQVDIDEIATDLNSKADVDLSNCTKPHVVETYSNGTSWYRVWSDGWCEQGGYVATGGSVTYLKPYLDTNYTLLATGATTSSNPVQYRQIMPNAYTATGFTGTTSSGAGLKWYTCGYIR